MERKLKFRAFGIDGIKKPQMYQWDYIKEAFDVWIMDETATIMQYTGLKDHSEPKKEIYEGDIINLYLDKELINTCIVVFSDGAFCLELYYDGHLYVPFHYYIEDEKTYTFEQIGNIYQNPELLK